MSLVAITTFQCRWVFYLSRYQPRAFAADTGYPLRKVDFEHKHIANNASNGRGQYDVRKLFYELAPPIVTLFFLDKGSKPTRMSLVPRNMPKHRHQEYAHLHSLNKLSIRLTRLVRPTGIEDDDTIAFLYSSLVPLFMPLWRSTANIPRCSYGDDFTLAMDLIMDIGAF